MGQIKRITLAISGRLDPKRTYQLSLGMDEVRNGTTLRNPNLDRIIEFMVKDDRAIIMRR